MNHIAAVTLLDTLPALGRDQLTTTLGQLESDDFDATGADLFYGLETIAGATSLRPDRPTVVALLHSHLLDSGELDGPRGRQLTARLARMAGANSEPLLVPQLVAATIDARYRRAVSTLGAALVHRAATSPLSDLDATLATGIEELRRLRMRIPAPTLRAVEGGAA